MTDGYGGAGALLPPLTARLPGLASAGFRTHGALHRANAAPAGRSGRAGDSGCTVVPPGRIMLSPLSGGRLRGAAGGHRAHGYGSVYPSAKRPVVRGSRAKGELTPCRPPDPWRAVDSHAGSRRPVTFSLPGRSCSPDACVGDSLAALSRKTGPTPAADPTSVDLVHHSRQGAAVLRYGVRQPAHRPRRRPATRVREGLSGQYDGPAGTPLPEILRQHRAEFAFRSARLLPRLNLGLTESLPGWPLLLTSCGPLRAPARTHQLQPVLAGSRCASRLHWPPSRHRAKLPAPVRTIRHLTPRA